MRGRTDGGFTLVEVMVALGLLSILMVATLPALVTSLRATQLTKTHTQAKNVSQERLDALRNLRYHVDRQNGPFLDLLDMYYTNAKSSGAETTVSSGGVTLIGKYVASGSGTGGEPTGPYYRVRIDSLPGMPGASQVVTAQFLTPSGSVVPASRFQDAYDSQMVGADQPPSLMLGVTVITKWTVGAQAKSYRTYTRITDGRAQLPVIQSQSRAIAVDVTSTAADGTTLNLQGGIASLDGAQSSGSSVTGYVTGALANQTGQPAVSGKVDQFAWPSPGASTSGSPSPRDGGSCAWYGFGLTGTTNVTSDISAGLPKAPANVADASPPNVVSGHIAHNGGGACGQLSYSNTVGGGVQRSTDASDAIGQEMGSTPFVRIPDTSGSGASIAGRGYVTSTPDSATPVQTKSGAQAVMGSQLVLFPNNAEARANGHGLVEVRLTSAQVDCVSGAGGSPGTVSGRYSVTLGWWGRHVSESDARWHSASWTYDSASGTAPVRSTGSDMWDPQNTLLASGVTLADLVPGISLGADGPAVIDEGAATGLRGFPTGVLTLTTASTLGNESGDGFSAINVRLGQLTCVADDLR